MADKVNNNDSIARVYQFLNKNKDWTEKADINGNGIICKTEFRTYLTGTNFFKNGESTEDIIDAFWKTMDTETKGKVAAGSSISNKNALSATEIQNFEKNMVVIEKIDKFMSNKEAPKEITNSNYRSRWKEEVKSELLAKALEKIQSGSVDDVTDAWLNEVYQTASNRATADFFALEEADKQVKDAFGDIDYNAGEDATLQGLIDNIETEGKTTEEIIAEVKDIVTAYIDTAQTNSDDTVEFLSKYGYDPNGELNDLQKAVLSKNMTSELMDYVDGKYPPELKSQVEAAIKEAIDKFLEGIPASAFKETEEKGAEPLKEEADGIVEDIQAQQEELNAAREDLYNYISGILSEGDADKTKIIKDVLGTTTLTSINNKLSKMDLEQINSTKATIESKLNALVTKLPSNFLDSLNDITISAGESATISLPNNYGSVYTTGHLHYSTTGDGVLSITDLGVAKISGNVKGVYSATVYVKNDNGVELCSKTITITIKESVNSIISGVKDKKMLLTQVDNWNTPEESFQSLYNGDKAIILFGQMDKGDRDWSSMKNDIKNNLSNLGSQILSMLVASNMGLDQSKLSSAVSTVVNQYYNAGAIRNKNDKGTSKDDLKNNCLDYMSQNREGTRSRIVWTVDTDGRDSNVYMIHFKDFVDDIIQTYLSL